MKVYSITSSPAPLKVTPIGNRLYRVAEDVTIRVSTSEGVWVFRFFNFEHPVSRLLGDKFLRAGLRWAGMGSFKASCVYNSVRLFGASAYDEDDVLTATNSRLFTFEWRDR